MQVNAMTHASYLGACSHFILDLRQLTSALHVLQRLSKEATGVAFPLAIMWIRQQLIRLWFQFVSKSMIQSIVLIDSTWTCHLSLATVLVKYWFLGISAVLLPLHWFHRLGVSLAKVTALQIYTFWMEQLVNAMPLVLCLGGNQQQH